MPDGTAKGRCHECGYVWDWPGTPDDLGDATCPTDGTVLARTTKPAQTRCAREQVGLK